MSAPKVNHWTEGGDLVIEQRTLFRRAGFLLDSGIFATTESAARALAKGGTYTPLYQQIAVDRGEGWED